MKKTSHLLGTRGALLLATGAGVTGAAISQTQTQTKQEAVIVNPQLTTAKKRQSKILPGIEPLQYEPSLFPRFTSPIWYGKSQRKKHVNKHMISKKRRYAHKKNAK